MLQILAKIQRDHPNGCKMQVGYVKMGHFRQITN